jgi:hypothetical protein
MRICAFAAIHHLDLDQVTGSVVFLPWFNPVLVFEARSFLKEHSSSKAPGNLLVNACPG